jgi:hypothetical protein
LSLTSDPLILVTMNFALAVQNKITSSKRESARLAAALMYIEWCDRN